MLKTSLIQNISTASPKPKQFHEKETVTKIERRISIAPAYFFDEMK